MKSTRSLRCQLRVLWVTNLVLIAAVCIAATPAVRPLLLDTSNHPTENVDFASSHWTGDATSGKAINPASIGAATPGTGAFAATANTPAITATGGGTDGRLLLQMGDAFGPATYKYGNFSAPCLNGNTYVLTPKLYVGNSVLDTALVRSSAGVAHLTDGGTGDGDLTLGNLTASGYLSFDGGLSYSDGAGGLSISTTLKTLGGGTLSMGNGGGSIYTAGAGGSINTGTSGGSINTSSGGGPIDTHNSGGTITTYINGGSIDTSDYGGSIKTNGSGAPTNTTARVGSLYCDQNSPNTSGHTLWVKTASGWVGL